MELKKNKISEHIRRNRFIPTAALLELTYKCNFNCNHCYRPIESRKELTKEEIFCIIDELASLGCFVIGFSGGEVFLRKDFLDIVEYSNKKGFGIHIYTNGSLINEDNIEKIKSINLIGLYIGFYGATKKTYTKITKNPTAKTKVVNAIKLLKKHKIPFILATLISKHNYEEFGKIITITKQLCNNTSCLGFNYKMLPTFDGGIKPLSCEISESQKKALSLDRAFKKYTKKSPYHNRKREFCEAGISSLGISPYGDVYPCTILRIPAGNIRQKKLKEIWQESENLSIVRKVLIKAPDICDNCKVRFYCHHCPGKVLLNKKEDGHCLSLLKKKGGRIING